MTRLCFFAISLTLISLLTACSSLNPLKGSEEVPEFNVHKITLENGLKVLLLENHRLPIFSFQIFYEVGGRDEQKGITGASHFLEHLMFKGAKKYGPGEFDYLIEGNGGVNNAYTTQDLTVYYENMPANMLEKIIDVEADRMNNLLVEPKAFEKERSVVLEERKMRYENSPRGKLYLKFQERLYHNTPYGTSVIGDIADLKSVSRDQIYQYFKKHYRPDNATVVVVGDINIYKAEAWVKEYFGPLKGSLERKKEKLKPYKINLTESEEHYLYGPSKNPVFMLGFPGVEQNQERSYALDMLASVLAAGSSSYLEQKYIYSKKPKMNYIYAWNNSLPLAGGFIIGGELNEGANIKEIKGELLQDLRASCDVEISEKNLQKVKNQYMIGLYSSLDTNAGLAKFLGNYEVNYGNYAYYQDVLEIYQDLDVDDVKKECKRIFANESILVSVWEKF